MNGLLNWYRPFIPWVKTLAGQLYSEVKELFPHNRVEYFGSNFDD